MENEIRCGCITCDQMDKCRSPFQSCDGRASTSVKQMNLADKKTTEGAARLHRSDRSEIHTLSLNEIRKALEPGWARSQHSHRHARLSRCQRSQLPRNTFSCKFRFLPASENFAAGVLSLHPKCGQKVISAVTVEDHLRACRS